VRAAQSHLATLNLALVPPNIAAPQDEAPEHVPRAARPRSVALPCLPSAAADFPSQSHGHPGVPGGDLTLTVGADGRVYCHDLTPGLAALLSDFCVPAHGATA
jgi:hypothetical protein